jgi:hypothetical protein
MKMSRPKSVILLFLTLSIISFVANASAQAVAENHWEAYAMESSMSGDAVVASSARGFRIGGAWRPSQYLSLVVDSGHYFDSVGNGPITLMAGPRFYKRVFSDSLSRRRRGWIDPYAQFLVGGQRAAMQSNMQGWNFVIAPGVGVDLLVADHVTFRIMEADVPLGSQRGSVRISTGFSFNFGR